MLQLVAWATTRKRDIELSCTERPSLKNVSLVATRVGEVSRIPL